MTNWNDLTTLAPELAADVRGRFDAHGLGLLATLRGDGSPRISGIEPWFDEGELWLGMMWQSLKALDLQRDGRLALHSATIDTKVTEGDARITGVAHEVVDDATVGGAVDAFEAQTGYRPPPGPMHLFRVAITEVMLMRPVEDHLLIRMWSAEKGERSLERR